MSQAQIAMQTTRTPLVGTTTPVCRPLLPQQQRSTISRTQRQAQRHIARAQEQKPDIQKVCARSDWAPSQDHVNLATRIISYNTVSVVYVRAIDVSERLRSTYYCSSQSSACPPGDRSGQSPDAYFALSLQMILGCRQMRASLDSNPFPRSGLAGLLWRVRQANFSQSKTY